MQSNGRCTGMAGNMDKQESAAAQQQEALKKTDTAEYRILQGMVGIKILKAFYHKHHFKTHAHDGYTLGIILNGAGGFRYKGKAQLTHGGHVTLLDPFEPHGGHVVGDKGWRYNTLYMSPGYLLETAADVLNPCPAEICFGRNAALSDPEIFSLLADFYSALDQNSELFEIESMLQLILSKLLSRYADPSVQLPDIRNETLRMKLIRDYIHANYRDKIMLSELARLTGFSKFQVIRMFQRDRGMSPHEYQHQLRIKAACRLLADKVSIAETALETGFHDQSHMSKTFKRIMGVTPGQYLTACNILQDTVQL